MDYDNWKTQTPEEFFGLEKMSYDVKVVATTTKQNFIKYWEGKENVKDVEKVDWEYDDGGAVFQINKTVSVWANDTNDLLSLIEKEISDYLHGIDNEIDFEIIK